MISGALFVSEWPPYAGSTRDEKAACRRAYLRVHALWAEESEEHCEPKYDLSIEPWVPARRRMVTCFYRIGRREKRNDYKFYQIVELAFASGFTAIFREQGNRSSGGHKGRAWNPLMWAQEVWSGIDSRRRLGPNGALHSKWDCRDK